MQLVIKVKFNIVRYYLLMRAASTFKVSKLWLLEKDQDLQFGQFVVTKQSNIQIDLFLVV